MAKQLSAEQIDRLEEIKEEIKDLTREAFHMIPSGTVTHSRAKSYWYAQIVMALDTDHGYLGGSMCTMEKTIEELREE